MRRLVTLAVRVLLAGAAAAIALRAGVRGGLVLQLYLLVVGGLMLEALVRAAAAAQPPEGASRFDQELRRPRTRPVRPEGLVRLEDRIVLATSSAADAYYRLRPLLRIAALELLASRRGIDLDGDPDRARAALGEEAWELLRPDLEPPRHRLARGIPLASLERVVADLERI